MFFEEDGKEYCTAKGSIEKILSLCEFMQDGDKISKLARQKLLKQHEKLASEGYVEVTLLGQNVNAYGKDLEGYNYTFANLLKDLQKTSIKRIRFTRPQSTI